MSTRLPPEPRAGYDYPTTAEVMRGGQQLAHGFEPLPPNNPQRGTTMTTTATAQCPLCGREGLHEHSAIERLCYRNGVKRGSLRPEPRPTLPILCDPCKNGRHDHPAAYWADNNTRRVLGCRNQGRADYGDGEWTGGICECTGDEGE